MKLLNTEVTPFTAAYFADAATKLFDGDVIYFDGEEMQKGEYHLTLADDRLSFKSLGDQAEPFEYILRFTAGDERKVHYRAIELNGKKYFTLWMAPWGEGHDTLRQLRERLTELNKGELSDIYLYLTDAAILSGFVVTEDENSIQLLQIPTWKTQNDQIVGRTPYTLDQLLTTGSEEIFFNNIWFSFPKLNGQYKVSWNADDNELKITGLDEEMADLADSETSISIPAMEEVNYNSPAMAKLGLVKDAPELTQVYSDETGRNVQFLKEDLGNAVYHSYVLGHGPSGLADQITLGSEAVHNEQLVAVLKHRYQMLQDAIPHEANVRTLELLDEIIVLQASRYKQREEEGILGTNSVGSAVTAKEEDTHVKTEVAEDSCANCDGCSGSPE